MMAGQGQLASLTLYEKAVMNAVRGLTLIATGRKWASQPVLFGCISTGVLFSYAKRQSQSIVSAVKAVRDLIACGRLARSASDGGSTERQAYDRQQLH